MVGLVFFEQMRAKNFYMILVLVVVSTLSIWFLSYPSSPSIHTIVSKTQTGFKNLPSNMQDQELTVDPIYLRRLGLAAPFKDGELSEPSFYQTGSKPNSEDLVLPSPMMPTDQPVIASAVKPDHFEEAAVLMKSVQSLLSSFKLIMYDMDVSSAEKVLLKKYCNSTWNCEIQKMEFEKYPSHIKYLEIGSYRPVCIQEILHRYGAVIWVDDGYYFTTSNVSATLKKAQKTGLQGWTIKDPTSSFTHQKMFQFFKTDLKPYYFQHPIESSRLVIYNNGSLVRQLILPWVKCALLEECINPPGAQNTGCTNIRRPYFLYRGCHRYDMSALNVLLGKVYNMEEESYSSSEELFGNLQEDKLRAENKTRQPAFEVGVGILQNSKI